MLFFAQHPDEEQKHYLRRRTRHWDWGPSCSRYAVRLPSWLDLELTSEIGPEWGAGSINEAGLSDV